MRKIRKLLDNILDFRDSIGNRYGYIHDPRPTDQVTSFRAVAERNQEWTRMRDRASAQIYADRIRDHAKGSS